MSAVALFVLGPVLLAVAGDGLRVVGDLLPVTPGSSRVQAGRNRSDASAASDVRAGRTNPTRPAGERAA